MVSTCTGIILLLHRVKRRLHFCVIDIVPHPLRCDGKINTGPEIRVPVNLSETSSDNLLDLPATVI